MTLHDIIIQIDHDISIPLNYDPIDDIIDAMWDIREIDNTARTN